MSSVQNNSSASRQELQELQRILSQLENSGSGSSQADQFKQAASQPAEPEEESAPSGSVGGVSGASSPQAGSATGANASQASSTAPAASVSSGSGTGTSSKSATTAGSGSGSGSSGIDPNGFDGAALQALAKGGMSSSELATWQQQNEAVIKGGSSSGSASASSGAATSGAATAGTSGSGSGAAAAGKATGAKAVSATGSSSGSGGAPSTSSGSGSGSAAGSSSGGGSGSGGSTLSPNAAPAIEALAPEINAASAATGISADTLGGQIWQESKGVNSPGGGYMQVSPDDANGNDISTASGNIMAGAEYDKQCLGDEGGDTDLMLRAFNSGPNSVDKSDPNTTTTGLGDKTYVTKVDEIAKDIASGAPQSDYPP